MKENQIPEFMRVSDAKKAEWTRAGIADGLFDLSNDEIWWRDRNHILDDHGYQLRSRLRPGWIPSWQDTDLDPLFCDDGSASAFTRSKKAIDAVRKSDGKDVAVMKMRRISYQRKVLQRLVDAQRTSGKSHHIVPVLESFEDDREPEIVFFAMPLFQRFDCPEFNTVSEVVQLFKQLLEALTYMHSVGIACRGRSLRDIVMDAPSVFPNGLHPGEIAADCSGVHLRTPKIIPRYKASGPIRYYFVDSDVWLLVEPDEERLALAIGQHAFSDIPEMSSVGLYDPFPADIFILGNMFKKHFVLICKNLEFLSPIVDAMTATKPAERPTAADALKLFKSIISFQSFFSLRRRLVRQEEKKSQELSVYEWVDVRFNDADETESLKENIGILVDAALYPVKVAIGIPLQIVGAVRRLIVSKISKAI